MLLWRPGEPPILLFTFAFPWLQGSVAIFHANWLGLDIAEYAPFQGDMQQCDRHVLGRPAGARRRHAARCRTATRGRRARRAQDGAVAADEALVPALCRGLGDELRRAELRLDHAGADPAHVGALGHALGRSSSCWASPASRREKASRGLFLAAFPFELAAGLGTYFADFKTVFFITLFAALASGTRVSSRALFGAGVLALLVVALAIVWTAVKGEYRVFVSGGQTEQIVAVDLVSRLAKLYELAANLDAETLSSAVDQLLRRLTYVEFFGVVLTYVPAYIPHTLGAILWDAIIRPFMPRLLFVDKDVIDDTARTNLYTGGLAGSSEATSISLGYIAEAYIDFGSIGMFAALLGIGLFYGAIYRVLSRWRRSQGSWAWRSRLRF